MVTKRVRVVLTEDVTAVGKSGEVLEVPMGYARNFLLKRGFADLATPERLSMLKSHKEEAQRKKRELLLASQRLGTMLTSMIVVLELPKNAKGTLYSAVREKDIVRILAEKHHITITERQISMEHPIKNAGEYKVTVRLDGGVTAHLAVKVV